MKLDLKKMKIGQGVSASPASDDIFTFNDPKEIGLYIKTWRKKQGLSQSDLAKYADVTRLTISRFEEGLTDIKLSTLLKIVRVCSLSISVKEK